MAAEGPQEGAHVDGQTTGEGVEEEEFGDDERYQGTDSAYGEKESLNAI